MLSHIMLRVAALDALCPAGLSSDGPWPTLAADRVFDSRISPVASLSDQEALPTLLIYTEEVEALSGSETNGLPHQATVTLVIEIGARQIVGNDVGAPETDPGLEDMLDMLGAQVYQRLVVSPPAAFFKARRRVTKYASFPFRDGEGGVKLAIRALQLSVELPTIPRGGDETAIANAVLELLPLASDGAATLTRAVAAVQTTIGFVAPDAQQLAGIDLTVSSSKAQPGTPELHSTLGAQPTP